MNMHLALLVVLHGTLGTCILYFLQASISAKLLALMHIVPITDNCVMRH